MPTNLRVGIVGGSVGGLFTGVLLHRQGHQVTVIERARHGLARRGAGLVVQEQVRRILGQVDRPDLAEVGVWTNERIVLDRRGEVISREHRPQMQMSWDLLYDGFRKLLPEQLYLTGAAVEYVERSEQRAQVSLIDGSTQAFDVLIGADGQGSTVRNYVNGDGSQGILPNYAGYVAWRGLVPEEAMPEQAKAQLFERMAFHFGEGIHALGYLIPGSDGQTRPGERRYNWVWYRTMPFEKLRDLLERAGRASALSLGPGELPEDIRDQLRADASALLPPSFAAAVTTEAQPFVQPIYDYETPRMINQRLALLGDAAFIARPHTAMGVAKAAGDAMTLAAAMAGRSIDEALAAYEKARTAQGQAVVDYGRSLGRSLSLVP